jgi:hypothetical protein
LEALEQPANSTSRLIAARHPKDLIDFFMFLLLLYIQSTQKGKLQNWVKKNAPLTGTKNFRGTTLFSLCILKETVVAYTTLAGN